MIAAIKKAARFAGDYLIPRFITEDVAVAMVGSGDNWDTFEIVCSMEDVEPGERFDGIAEVDAFMWFGIGVTYRVGNFRAWGSDPWGDA